MGHLQNLIIWAKAQGVVTNGIQPSKIPGRGTGILATRKIKVVIGLLVLHLWGSNVRQ
jgi:hypothetical protein